MVLEGLIFNNFTLGRSGGLERTDFCQFSLWKDVVVCKGLILIFSLWEGFVS